MTAYLFFYFREEASKDVVQCRIILFQFFAGVDLVVLAVAIVVVYLCIYVEPVLDPFGPILVNIGSGVNVFPFAFGYGIV